MINNVIIIFSALLIGFVMILSMLPNIVLFTSVTIGGFIIPVLIIFITMIIQIKKAKEIEEKNEIRNYWLKIIFIIYCLFLVTILFLNNEYRRMGFQNVKLFSKEHMEINNIVPFATIIGFFDRLISHNINTNIVVVNLVSNLILFAPMGFFVPMLFKDKIKNVKQFVIMILIITLVVEILQFLTFRGTADIDDIILNTLGAVIVYALMKTKFVRKLLYKIMDVDFNVLS